MIAVSGPFSSCHSCEVHSVLPTCFRHNGSLWACVVKSSILNHAVKHLVPPHHLFDGEGRQNHIGVAADNYVPPGNSNARVLCMPPTVMRLPHRLEPHIQAQVFAAIPTCHRSNRHQQQPLPSRSWYLRLNVLCSMATRHCSSVCARSRPG